MILTHRPFHVTCRSEEGTTMAEVAWTTVRVSRDTLAWLERTREAMLAGGDSAVLPLECPAARSGKRDRRDRIGLDRVIRRLLADRQRWQERKVQSRQR